MDGKVAKYVDDGDDDVKFLIIFLLRQVVVSWYLGFILGSLDLLSDALGVPLFRLQYNKITHS